ncbi:MAG: alanine racemase [Acidobacteriota bacterium]|nr:alanine racemase [Acidobacteriota bacterium]
MIDSKLAGELAPQNYRVDSDALLTPALAIYPDAVQHNIQSMLRLLEGKPGRWRPHLKTVKLASMIRLLVDSKVTSAKCATTLELLVACQSGMRDVLVAYPHGGRNVRRIAEIAAEFPEVHVSAIVESEEQVRPWMGTPVGLFIDINTGMDRTGMRRDSAKEIGELASAIEAANLIFRGIHFYDGHATEADLEQRTVKAHARYEELLAVVSRLDRERIRVAEVITSGTPALPCALSYPGLWNASFTCQVSPGTVVYGDASSLQQLPQEYGFRSAVLVISRVVSHPKTNVITCDAGHKSLSVDSGVPNCIVLENPGLRPLKPSEEHLPLEVDQESHVPEIGSALYLMPRHVCPTVNNFNEAVMVNQGVITGMEPVSARGREAPLISSQSGDGSSLHSITPAALAL